MKETPEEKNVSEFSAVKFPVMPGSYIFLNDMGRQRSECPSETLEITAVGFLKSWLPFLWMYSHSPLFQSCLLSTKTAPALKSTSPTKIQWKESVQIQRTDNQIEKIGKNKKISSCFGWKCIFQGIKLPKIYTFNLNAYQGVSMMTSQALEVPQERHGNSSADWIREDKAEYRNMGVKWGKGTLLGVPQMRAEHSTWETPHGRVKAAIKVFLMWETTQWSWGAREEAGRIIVLVKQRRIKAPVTQSPAKAEGRTEWRSKRASATHPSIFKS